MKNKFLIISLIVCAHSLHASQTPTADQLAADLADFKQQQNAENDALAKQAQDATALLTNVDNAQQIVANSLDGLKQTLTNLSGLGAQASNDLGQSKGQLLNAQTALTDLKKSVDAVPGQMALVKQETQKTIDYLMAQIVALNTARENAKTFYDNDSQQLLAQMTALAARILVLENKPQTTCRPWWYFGF